MTINFLITNNLHTAAHLRIFCRSWILLSALLLLSCATSHQAALTAHHAADICCTSMSEFNYERLGQNELIGFELNKTSPSYQFRGGKSYFKAFKLPEYESPYLLAVKTYTIGEVADRFHIFSPVLTILDENYSIAREICSEQLHFQRVKFGESLTVGGGSPIAAEISLVIDSPEYKYIVIHTTDKQLLGHGIKSAPDLIYIPISSGGIFFPTGKTRHFAIPHSPFGKLVIEARMHNGQVSP